MTKPLSKRTKKKLKKLQDQGLSHLPVKHDGLSKPKVVFVVSVSFLVGLIVGTALGAVAENEMKMPLPFANDGAEPDALPDAAGADDEDEPRSFR